MALYDYDPNFTLPSTLEEEEKKKLEAILAEKMSPAKLQAPIVPEIQAPAIEQVRPPVAGQVINPNMDRLKQLRESALLGLDEDDQQRIKEVDTQLAGMMPTEKDPEISQQLLAQALVGALPGAIGALIGGKGGAAVGFQEGQKAVGYVADQQQKERQKRIDAEKAVTAARAGLYRDVATIPLKAKSWLNQYGALEQMKGQIGAEKLTAQQAHALEIEKLRAAGKTQEADLKQKQFDALYGLKKQQVEQGERALDIKQQIANKQKTPKQGEQTIIPGFSVIEGASPTKDDVKKVKDAASKARVLNNSLNELLVAVKKHGPVVNPFSSEGKELNRIFSGLLLESKEESNLGALTGPDMALMSRNLTDPVGIQAKALGKDEIIKNIKEAQRILNDKVKERINPYGFVPVGSMPSKGQTEQFKVGDTKIIMGKEYIREKDGKWRIKK